MLFCAYASHSGSVWGASFPCPEKYSGGDFSHETDPLSLLALVLALARAPAFAEDAGLAVTGSLINAVGALDAVAMTTQEYDGWYIDAVKEAMDADRALLEAVMNANTLDGLIPVIREAGCGGVWTRLCRAASAYGEARTKGAPPVDADMLDGEGRILGSYEGGRRNGQ